MTRLGIWLAAFRPKTLAAAAAPVAVGTAVALDHGLFRPAPALAALAGALLIQIGTNLANDYFDYLQGADTEERVGPTRAIPAGLLTARQVLSATVAVFALAVLVGVYLTWVAGWPIVAIGAASIVSGVAYTAGGPRAIGYLGLGDLFVFVFFGPVAVVGTYYVQGLAWASEALWASVPVGALSVAILVVNNHRDADTDVKAGKKTLAVRFGRRFTRAEYTILLGLAYLVPFVQLLAGMEDTWVLLPWVTVPFAWPALQAMLHTTSPVALNLALGQTARLLIVFALAHAAGILL